MHGARGDTDRSGDGSDHGHTGDGSGYARDDADRGRNDAFCGADRDSSGP